jgi:PKD domain
MGRATRTFLVLLAVATLAGCTVSKSTPPSLTGPSVLGLSITLQANPDVLSQDGSSQSILMITARDANSLPVQGLALRLAIVTDGSLANPGLLSAQTAVTDTAGRASASYTAPASPTVSTQTSVPITITATPIGADASGAQPRAVTINLIPTGTIVPPAQPDSAPTADFVYSPDAPTVNQTVYFNASASKPGLGRTIVSYDWDFRPSPAQQGVMVSAKFSEAGLYNVTLVVTDDLGQRGTVTKAVTVQ